MEAAALLWPVAIQKHVFVHKKFLGSACSVMIWEKCYGQFFEYVWTLVIKCVPVPPKSDERCNQNLFEKKIANMY